MTNWLIGGLVVIAVALGGLYIFNQGAGPEGDAMMKGEVMMEKDDAMMEEDAMHDADAMEDGTMMKDDSVMMGDGAMMSIAGSYEIYAPEKLAKANEGKVVLFFRATWCPTCKVLDSDIRSHLKNIPEGVTILDVDYDTYTALKQKYGVTYQHTLVQVDAQGNQIAKWSGGLALADVLSHIQ